MLDSFFDKFATGNKAPLADLNQVLGRCWFWEVRVYLIFGCHVEVHLSCSIYDLRIFDSDQ